MRECTVTGCSHPAAGYSTHCEHHRRTQRRHGHPEQEGVTTKELEPYLRRVRARIRKNSASPAWTLLHARWETLVEAAKEAEARYQNGGVFIRHQRRAEGELRKLAEEVEAEAITATALALYLLQEERPHRFRSDAAFAFQLARRVRGLAEVNAGESWDHKAGRIKRVYRDLPPRATVILAEMIKAVFGLAGLHVARLEQEEAARKNREQAALYEALEGLE